jgi:hypothetical protein
LLNKRGASDHGVRQKSWKWDDEFWIADGPTKPTLMVSLQIYLGAQH